MKKYIFLVILSLFVIVSISAQDNPLYFGATLEGYPINKRKLTNVSNEFGIKPDLIVFFLMWPKKEDIAKGFNLTFSLRSIDTFGSVACISWEPMFLQNSYEQVVLKDDIVNGLYDKYLDEFIFQIKSFNKSVIIRFAHEMNLSRYHWGVLEDNYNENSPDIYIEMFRYIFDYFKKKKVKNALFAFCPNVDSVPKTSWNKIKNYYPGDKYVDILGMDGYNWGTCASEKNLGWVSSWRSFNETFKNTLRELRKLSLFKPIIIFETASAKKGGDRTLWLQEALKDARKLDISAICWFQVNKECNWKITKNQKNVLKKYFSNRKYKKYSIKDWIEELN